MADFKIVRKTEREFAAGYVLGAGELGQEIDTERVKAGPGVWSTLPYLVDGPIDMNTLQALLTLHLAQTDPHLDRQYAAGLIGQGGGGGGTPVTTLVDTDTVQTSAGPISVADLRTVLVTDQFVGDLPTMDAIAQQSASNAAALVGLDNDSTVISTHNRGAAVAGSGVAIVDTYAASTTRLFESEDRMIYTIDNQFVNVSGLAANITMLNKVAGVNGHTKTLSLPSTAAGQLYLSTMVIEIAKVTVAPDHTGHWHRTRWMVRAAGAAGNATPVESYFYDGEWQNNAEATTGTDWGPFTVAVESRWTPATGIDYRFMGSSLIHTKGIQ